MDNTELHNLRGRNQYASQDSSIHVASLAPSREPSETPARDGKSTAAAPISDLSRAGSDHGLRYRKRAIWVLCIYLPVLILPWAFTCVTMYRPMTKTSYINQAGNYTMADIQQMERWTVAIDVLQKMASVLGVPVVSALLAQGAVVYLQRRHHGQEFNLEQMFALANRGWSDIPTLWSALFIKTSKNSTPYLWLAACLVVITAIQPALEAILVQQETKLIVTCNDQVFGEATSDERCNKRQGEFQIVGIDAEPAYLSGALLSAIIQSTRDKMTSFSFSETQPRIWRSEPPSPDMLTYSPVDTLGYFYESTRSNDTRYANKPYFVSSVLNGTTTGVMREHAVRMDSQSKCELVDDYPDSCPGNRPFTMHYGNRLVNVSVCVEGSFDKVPWTTSRNKQEITERIWMDLKSPSGDEDSLDDSESYLLRMWDLKNFTMRCDATSRRGWFELGNYQNNYTQGPLLDNWPKPEDLKENYNDYNSLLGDGYYRYYPAVDEPEPEDSAPWPRPPNVFESQNLKTPGPLMTAALAMFGNNTFFYSANEFSNDSLTVYKQTCQDSRIPFYTLSSSYIPEMDDCSFFELSDDNTTRLPRLIAKFMMAFSKPENAFMILELGMFFANEALLSITAGTGWAFGGRYIYTSPGYSIVKPKQSLEGLIIISLLIGLQVLGLTILMLFLYSRPTWTGYLDAESITLIGMQIKEQGHGLDGKSVSGVVGAVENDFGEHVPLMNESGQNTWKTPQEQQVKRRVALALGGPGVI